MQDSPGNNFTAAAAAIEKLLQVMAMLRHPEHGCPWDLEQTITSLVPFTIEEVYEVVDSIERNDMVDFEDELGDLLFQIVFYTQLTREDGGFSLADVAQTVTNKLLRRHPHVFSDGTIDSFGKVTELSSEDVVSNWEAIKQLEREEKRARQVAAGQSAEAQVGISILDDIPRALPALERARKLQKRAARAGFDWHEMAPVIAKVREELDEFEQALAQGDHAKAENELGDVFFSAVNLARHHKTEPEVALRQANLKFEARFQWIESKLKDESKALGDCSLEELDTLWNQAKANGL